MAIDNSLYDSLENTYMKIKDYFDSTQLGREHSAMIIKHEELAELLATFDIEALEEQSKDINALHGQFDNIKEVANKITLDLANSEDSITTGERVVGGIDKVFLGINNLVL